METVLGLHSRLNQLILETFRRGMETGGTHRLAGRGPALKPSLEGWKRSEDAPALEAQLHLETFLRGMETSTPGRSTP